MALLDLHPGRRLADGLLALLDIHPAAFLGEMQAHREARRMEARLADLPAHIFDDIGVERGDPADEERDLGRATTMTAALRS